VACNDGTSSCCLSLQANVRFISMGIVGEGASVSETLSLCLREVFKDHRFLRSLNPIANESRSTRLVGCSSSLREEEIDIKPALRVCDATKSH
jgi:hypothetical protein